MPTDVIRVASFSLYLSGYGGLTDLDDFPFQGNKIYGKAVNIHLPTVTFPKVTGMGPMGPDVYPVAGNSISLGQLTFDIREANEPFEILSPLVDATFTFKITYSDGSQQTVVVIGNMDQVDNGSYDPTAEYTQPIAVQARRLVLSLIHI